VNALDTISLAQARSFTRSGAARAVRVAAGLSLREMAEPLGVAPSTVLRWERCERSPRGEKALAYKKLLDGLVGNG
jgi:transcriptional regulator with XRE-family HTH domain